MNPDVHETLELLQLAAWSSLLQFALKLALFGLMLASALGLSGYFFHENILDRFWFMGGATGCLVASAVGINMVDRIRKKSSAPWLGALGFLILCIAALLALFLKSEELSNSLPWPLLVAAGYTAMMCGALWRLRAFHAIIRRHR